MTPSEITLPPSDSPLGGEVVISDVVLAKLAGKAVRTTYGVVDVRRSPARSLARFFRGSLTDGVEVDIDGNTARIGLHVVMERGVNLTAVTANIHDQVRYFVEHYSGVTVSEVNVRVEDLHE